VEKYEDIKNVICPIFNIFPLHTSKKLDFEDFKEAVLIKSFVRNKLSGDEINRIKSIKNGMNLNRKIFTYKITNSQVTINPN
jgi:hypothetical protein